MIIDEIDLFIINSCISNMSYNAMAAVLKGYDIKMIQNRVEDLKNKGINVYPGMKGEKLRTADIEVLELAMQGFPQYGIAQILKKSVDDVKCTIRRFRKTGITLLDDALGLDPAEKKDKVVERKPKYQPKNKDLDETIQMKIVGLIKQGNPIQVVAKKMNTERDFLINSIGRCVKTGKCIPELEELWQQQGIWCLSRGEGHEFDAIDKIILKYMQKGYTIKKMAEILHYSKNAITVRISKIKERGISKLEDFEEPGIKYTNNNEKFEKVLRKIIQERNLSQEQLEIVAEYFDVDLDDVLSLSKYLDEK